MEYIYNKNLLSLSIIVICIISACNVQAIGQASSSPATIPSMAPSSQEESKTPSEDENI